MKQFWTPERKTELAGLWAQGLSASMIATKMDGTTRNSVIGAIHRYGEDWPRGARPTRPAKSIIKVKRKAPFAAPSTIETKIKACTVAGQAIVARLEAVEITGDPVNLLDARACHCRFVVSPVNGASTLFCGREVARSGRSWCSDHLAIVFQRDERKIAA